MQVNGRNQHARRLRTDVCMGMWAGQLGKGATLSIYRKGGSMVEYRTGGVTVDRNSVGGNVDNSDGQQLRTLKKKWKGTQGANTQTRATEREQDVELMGGARTRAAALIYVQETIMCNSNWHTW